MSKAVSVRLDDGLLEQLDRIASSIDRSRTYIITQALKTYVEEYGDYRVALDRLLEESDFLVVTVPLTPETRGMIGEREFRLMKPTSYLVNVARAAIVQEEPLYRALEEGWIAGAALDVWWRPHWWDPLWVPEGGDASDYPFWELPNVICTPHNIGSTDARSDAGIRIMAENIQRVKEGRPPVNLVDKELRY